MFRSLPHLCFSKMQYTHLKVLLRFALILVGVVGPSSAYPSFPDVGTHTEDSIETNHLGSRDTSNLESENSLFLSDSPASVDEIALGSTFAASNQSTQPGRALKSSSNSDEKLDNSLHLRSSNRSVVGVNGDTLYASPINATELLALLLSTRNDLWPKAKADGQTNFYRSNHTTWAFEVAVGHGTLQYASILVIVTRFLHLLPSRFSEPFTWSRVGCVYRGGEPIADVAILPLVPDQQPTSTGSSATNAAHIPVGPVEIMTITPQGVNNSTEIISPNALDIYRHNLASHVPKRQASSIERDIIMKVFDSGYFLTVEIRRNPDGIVARTMTLFLAVTIWLGLCKLALGLVAGLLLDSWAVSTLGEFYRLDSGSYRLGQLSARFILQATARDHEGKLVAFKMVTFKEIATALLEPLLQVQGRQEPAYAVGGEILGPDPVNGTGKVVPLGTWEIDVEPAQAINHDEL